MKQRLSFCSKHKNIKRGTAFFAILLCAILLCSCAVNSYRYTMPTPVSTDIVAASKNVVDNNKIKVGVTIQGYTQYVIRFLNVLNSRVDQSKMQFTVLDSNNNAEKQIEHVDSFIAENMDIILINAASYTDSAMAVEMAVDAKIPVVAFITLVENQELCSTYVGWNHKESGAVQAEMMAEYLGYKGDIIVLEGVPGMDSMEERSEAYDEVLKKYDEINIVNSQPANWEHSQSYEIVKNWIDLGKKFDAVLSQNDSMALGAIRALEERGMTDKLVFGIDGDSMALDAIKSGSMTGTILQDVEKQVDTLLDCIDSILANEPIEKYYNIPFFAITEENIGSYLN